MFTFDEIIALNPETGLPEPNLTGQVYARDDTALTTPLTVFDLSGVPLSVVSSGPLGKVRTFQHPDEPIVIWAAGDHRFVLRSYDGILERMVEAQQAAANALIQANQARSELEQYIATYPGSGYVADDATVADLVNAPTLTRGAVIAAATAAGAAGLQPTDTPSQVYATDAAGDQATLAWAVTALANAIAVRDSSGRIASAAPSAAEHVVTKAFLDAALAGFEPTGGGSAAGVFCVRYIAGAWEYASLEDAIEAGLRDTEVLLFLGTAAPPLWSTAHPRGSAWFGGG